MSKTDKLLSKLRYKSISADELRTLLRHLGWRLDRCKGSHEQWIKNGRVVTLATHGQELKTYQIKQFLEAIEENL
jgi:predicted RNA binding protein YcfA (HicA-like mRNA interferase family)